jgi:hypothetical protein
MKFLLSVWFAVIAFFARPVLASAEWTPLVTSTMFDGIQTDLGTIASGMVTLLLIVLGIGIIWKVFTH